MSKGYADRVIKNNSEVAESTELIKRSMERAKDPTQREKEEAIASVFEMAGKIKATNFFKTQTEFFNLLMLKKVKDTKEYRTRFGMTWEQFCEHVGLKRRTVDLHLEDLEPFRQDFLATFCQFSGVELSKIKYLGMAVSGNVAEIQENAIIYNGETIPLDPEHRDEIHALLERLEETSKQQIEEKDAEIRAKHRLLKSKEDLVNKMEREIKRLEKTVEMEPLSEEEQEVVEILRKIQADFIEGISTIKKKIPYDKAPTIALRQLYFLYIFISKVCMDERLALFEVWKDAEEVPWEITEEELPPADAIIEGIGNTRTAFVVSVHSTEIKDRIISEMERGTTMIKATGGFTGEERPVLMVSLRRREIGQLRHIVKAIDKKAFVILVNNSEVFGEGFKNLN